MKTRRTLVFALVTLMALACSSHEDPTGTDDDDGSSQTGQVVEVQLVNFAFTQPTVTIQAGTTVRWRNTTGDLHTVTPDGHSAWNEWETNTPGETFEVTFDAPGSYPYYCVPHRSLGMTGTVIVQ